MSQNEKDILLEKFLARGLSEADKTAFEDLVRTDESFAQEVALRLAEADAFHRARTADKVDIQRRYRRRKWLRWAVWGGLGLLGLVGMVNLGGNMIKERELQKQRKLDEYKLLQPHPPDTFDIVVPFREKKIGAALPVAALCIRDISWLDSIPQKRQAGGGNTEALFVAKKYLEALRAANAYLSERDSVLAAFPRDCLVAGALNICLPEGDVDKAVRYLEVVRESRYKTKNSMILLAFSYACKGDCGKARALVQKEKITLPPDLNRWLSGCKPRH